MTRVWFAQDLETVATFWRVLRRDGIALGFTTHDRDLWFDGVMHRAAPGMIPSSIRRSADFEPDSAEVEGALSHESISSEDLAAGRFDGAQVRIGLIDWETGDQTILYRGAIGSVTEEDGRFSAELVSRKAELLRDPVPRTSPACRALFCGPDCALPAVRFTHDASIALVHPETNEITIEAIPGIDSGSLVGGSARFVDGPHAGIPARIMLSEAFRLLLDIPVGHEIEPGMRIVLREGCDHTLATCAGRFANAPNFRGEPFLPGNDHISRYPQPA